MEREYLSKLSKEIHDQNLDPKIDFNFQISRRKKIAIAFFSI